MDDNIDLDNDNICGICYAEFLDDDDLKLHIKQYHLHETSKNRFCNFCSKIFSDICSFAIHFRNAHLSTITVCKYCTRIFDDNFSISEHEKKHKRSLYYPKISCSQCTEVFKDNNEVINHEYENHRDCDGVFLQYCYPELSAVFNFNARNFFQSKEVNFMYSCVVCDLSTLDVNEYIRHLQTVKCRSYSCNVCCNTFPWKSRLENHCRTHDNVKEAVLNDRKCPKCAKYFQLSKLKAHLKECTSMKCIPCDMLFDSVETLTIHVSTHCQRTSVLFENCKYCRRPFVGPNQLKKHIERAHKHNIHLYKYCCIYCNILFRHPRHLFGHFFTKHKDINPYTCKICNIGFRIRKNLTLHIKLDHKSVGFVEFDSNYHVFFTDKKSEKPFQPKNPDMTDLSDKECNKEVNSKTTVSTVSTDDNIDTKKSNKDNTEQTFEGIDTTDQVRAININEHANNTETLIEKSENTAESLNETTNESDIDTDVSKKSETIVIDIEKQLTGSNDEVVLEEIKLQDDHKTTNDEQSSNCEIQEVVDDVSTNNMKFGIELVNVDSDFMNAAEAEGDHLVIRNKKRKIKNRVRSKIKSQSGCDSSDSDAPLAKIVKKTRKRRRLKGKRKNRVTKNTSKKEGKKTKFICLKCNQNCYTYQSYHRHMSLHMKNCKKICVKCFAKFQTKEELNNHMKAEHSSSKLTETLKKLLDKRKNSVTQNEKSPEKFRESVFSKTIHKVQFEASTSQATMTEVVEDRLSVKKFLETFKPDTTDGTSKKVSISNTLSIRAVTEAKTDSVIKMNKFKVEKNSQITTRPQLRMPVKFKEEPGEEYSVSIKLVHCENVASTLNFDNEVTVADDNGDFEAYDVQNKAEVIPEVGHEIFLDQTDANKSKVLKKTILLKDLASYDNVRIGHLAPQAPYYKIVKIDEVLEKRKKVDSSKEINITLPNGTKLVSVNPLAHLLNNKTVAEIPKTNTYNKKPNNNKDIREAILNAMKVLESAPVKRKSVKKTEVTK